MIQEDKILIYKDNYQNLYANLCFYDTLDYIAINIVICNWKLIMRLIMEHPIIRFEINPKKGVALLQILLDKVGGSYDYKALLKLAFFADRYHIRNYARPIVGDDYFAMKHGPVPSFMKDSIESQDIYDGNIGILPKSKYIVKLKSSKNIDKTLFSRSDFEAIDFSVSRFGKIGKDVWHIVDLSHAYPEWDIHKDNFIDNISNRVEMYYVDFLNNANPNHKEFRRLRFTNPFIPLTNSDKQDIIEEMNEITNLYNVE